MVLSVKKPICKMRGWSFSWNRFFGITGAKQSFARRTGIPTTRNGLYNKVGRITIQFITNFFKK